MPKCTSIPAPNCGDPYISCFYDQVCVNPDSAGDAALIVGCTAGGNVGCRFCNSNVKLNMYTEAARADSSDFMPCPHPSPPSPPQPPPSPPPPRPPTNPPGPIRPPPMPSPPSYPSPAPPLPPLSPSLLSSSASLLHTVSVGLLFAFIGMLAISFIFRDTAFVQGKLRALKLPFQRLVRGAVLVEASHAPLRSADETSRAPSTVFGKLRLLLARAVIAVNFIFSGQMPAEAIFSKTVVEAAAEMSAVGMNNIPEGEELHAESEPERESDDSTGAPSASLRQVEEADTGQGGTRNDGGTKRNGAGRGGGTGFIDIEDYGGICPPMAHDDDQEAGNGDDADANPADDDDDARTMVTQVTQLLPCADQSDGRSQVSVAKSSFKTGNISAASSRSNETARLQRRAEVRPVNASVTILEDDEPAADESVSDGLIRQSKGKRKTKSKGWKSKPQNWYV